MACARWCCGRYAARANRANATERKLENTRANIEYL
jgi:hypothetical protein